MAVVWLTRTTQLSLFQVCSYVVSFPQFIPDCLKYGVRPNERPIELHSAVYQRSETQYSP